MTLDSFNSGEILYESELRAMQQTIGWGGYHLNGWDVTGVTTLTITFNAGNGVNGAGGFESTAAPSNVIITAGDATYDRIDLVIYDQSANQLDKITGVPSSSPNPPDLVDYDDIILYRVHVDAGATSISTSDIYDARAKRSEPIIRENRSYYNGAITRWYSDDGTTEKIKLDGATGKGVFAGDVKVTNHLDLDFSGNTYLLFQESTSEKARIEYHVTNNRLEVTTTGNEDIYLNPFGTGHVRVDAHVVPDGDGFYNIGSTGEKWDFIYANNVIAGALNTNTIKASDGNTNMSLTSNTLTTFAGDIRINGNDIQASNGNTNITLNSNTLTTFAGDIRVNGNDIQASDGNANITMSSNTLTIFWGDIRVEGDDIQDSNGNVVFSFNGSGDVDNTPTFQEGFHIGPTIDSTKFDDAATGGSTTTMYIGNASISTSSDSRLKKDITKTTKNGLDIIDKLNVVDFVWDDPTDKCENNRNSRGKWTGLIAQEVVDVVPYVVNAPDRTCDVCRQGLVCEKHPNYWFMEYNNMVPLLIKCIQELKEKIDSLDPN